MNTYSKVPELDEWIKRTDANVGNIVEMPEKAQREISASIVSMEVYDFKCELDASTHWDVARRKVNYEACCGAQAGRWTQVVPWDRHGHLNMRNVAYLVRPRDVIPCSNVPVLYFCVLYKLRRLIVLVNRCQGALVLLQYSCSTWVLFYGSTCK